MNKLSKQSASPLRPAFCDASGDELKHIDPVCGMTVDSHSVHRAEHAGAQYVL